MHLHSKLQLKVPCAKAEDVRGQDLGLQAGPREGNRRGAEGRGGHQHFGPCDMCNVVMAVTFNLETKP